MISRVFAWIFRGIWIFYNGVPVTFSETFVISQSSDAYFDVTQTMAGDDFHEYGNETSFRCSRRMGS